MSELALQLITENKSTKSPFLDLGNCGLTELPNELFDCIWLESLCLGNFYFDVELKKKISSPKRTDSNSFNGKELDSLQKLKKLHSLFLSFNDITDLQFLDKLIGLQFLDLYFNKITDSEIAMLSNLKRLQFLDIGHNEISNASIKNLENLTNLTYFYCSNTKITDFSSLEKINTLQTLEINRNNITNIDFVKNLRILKNLYIRENKINDLRLLEKLTELEFLDVCENPIIDFNFLYKLKKLTSLSLFNIKNVDLSSLHYNSSLIHLGLTSNKIKNISFIQKLTNLQSLGLGDNNIKDISYLSHLTKLKKLYLWDNQLRDISELKHLTNLESLELSGNPISDFSPLRNLKKIHYLNLSNCQITDINFLSNLLQINDLNLRGNLISDISNLIPLIQKGLNIDFDDNYDKKNKIKLSENPITTPPMHIIEQGNEAILRYFNAGRLKPLNECKLIFVGDGGVGKTCLMKRLVHDTFDEKEEQTHGINKIAWQGIVNKKKEQIKVNLWDFGGQDIQHSLHQFFFTERVVYVLVLNPRNDEKAAYWLEQIEKLGADSEVLVVYNWKNPKDLEAPFMSNFYELRKKYNKLSEPFIVSAKTGEGIEAFKIRMNNAILHNEGLVQEYPDKWFNIKHKLEENVSIGANYINYETYQDWCNGFDYKDESDQRALLVTLDKIGSIVFFNRPILNQLQVLNPEWITTGAYAILTSKITKEKNGHLNMSDLREVFKEEKEIFSNKTIKIKYAENQFQFIIQLMLTYDLCQENPLIRHEYLIPSAFGSKPSKNYDIHKEGSRVYRIQFDSPFEMLIIHRFIARNLLKAHGKDYWQSGIFIKDTYSNTFALVETNLHSFRIDFWVKGDNIRGFWEAMRRDFQEIFSIYKKFTYKEEVFYKQDKREVFLPYQEMLDSLQDGVRIIPYHSTYRLKNINVLAVLDLFEDAEKTEQKVKNETIYSLKNIDVLAVLDLFEDVAKTEQKVKNETIMEKSGDTYNFYGNVNNPKQFGGSGNEFNEGVREAPKSKPDPQIEAEKDKKLKQWIRNGWLVFIPSLLVTLLLFGLYFQKSFYIFSETEWKELKENSWIKVAGIAILTSYWSLFAGKFWYDRVCDPSKQKAYRERL